MFNELRMDLNVGKVIDGNFTGSYIMSDKNGMTILYPNGLKPIKIPVNKDTVANYKMIKRTENSQSLGFSAGGAIVGGLILGPVGAMIGGAKNRHVKGHINVVIDFKDGGYSTIQIAEWTYKNFVKEMQGNLTRSDKDIASRIAGENKAKKQAEKELEKMEYKQNRAETKEKVGRFIRGTWKEKMVELGLMKG